MANPRIAQHGSFPRTASTTILQHGFATEEIHAHLRKTLIEPDSLQRYVFFRPERYTRNLVFKNDVRLSYWLFAGTSASRRRSTDMKASAAGVGSSKAACYCATTASFPKTHWWCGKSANLIAASAVISTVRPIFTALRIRQWQWHPRLACTSILIPTINAIFTTSTTI